MVGKNAIPARANNVTPLAAHSDRTELELCQMSPLMAVFCERAKQDAKWGQQDHLPGKWLMILMEEVGEIAENLNEADPAKGDAQFSETALRDNLQYELVQVAAVCVAWLESIVRKAETT